MKSSSRPHNGPSTTGKPSGKGRGNNPSGNTMSGGNGISNRTRVFNPKQRVMYIHSGRPDNYGRSYSIGQYSSGQAWTGGWEFKYESPSGRVFDDTFFVRVHDERCVVNIMDDGDRVELKEPYEKYSNYKVPVGTQGVVENIYANPRGDGPYYNIKFDGLDDIIAVPSIDIKYISKGDHK